MISPVSPMQASPKFAPDSDYRELIAHAFRARKARNPRYSVRAFAKFLGVSKTSLAAVIARERHLAEAAALRIAGCLGFTEPQIVAMLSQIRGSGPERFDCRFHTLESD